MQYKKQLFTIVLGIIILMFTSCVSVKPVFDKFGSRWIGQQADEFFVRYGPPIQSYQLKNGGTIYTWQSDVGSVSLPGHASSTTVGSGNRATTTTTYSPGSTIYIYCILQIETNDQNIITKIKLTKDTWGYWVNSRFYEIFKNDLE